MFGGQIITIDLSRTMNLISDPDVASGEQAQHPLRPLHHHLFRATQTRSGRTTHRGHEVDGTEEDFLRVLGCRKVAHKEVRTFPYLHG